MKILLLGYMGAGKSAVASSLSKKTNIPFFDLDAVIETEEKNTINDIFAQKGELYFRKIESVILKELICNNDNFILALGGGTPCYANNYLLLQEEGIISVYLKASVETLTERLVRDKINRPLIAKFNKEELYDYIRKHLFERNFYYLQSTLTVNVDAKSIDEIVNEIEKLLF